MKALSASQPRRTSARRASFSNRKAQTRSTHIDNLAEAVERLKHFLAKVAGTAIGLEVECLACSGLVRLSSEELTRILVRLTRNAAAVMPQGGRIRITVQQGGGGNFLDDSFGTPSP